jgi:hypothetical protein
VQIICFQQIVVAQDSISVSVSKPLKKKKFSPDPLKATMLAVALPGMGQVYNRKYWKIPLVYAGFGSLVYAIGFNTGQYSKFMKAYQDLTDQIPQTNSYLKIKGLEDVPPSDFDINKNPQRYQYYKDQMLRYVDYYKRYRDLSYIGIGAWYLVSILDANVDASLFNYDVSDNLDIAVMPVQVTAPGGFLVAGVNVSLKLNF